MSKKSKPKSRWNAGNKRYTEKDLIAIAQTYHEPRGWYHGAKVYDNGSSAKRPPKG